MSIEVAKITRADYPAVAAMVGELLEEIMAAIDTRAFNFSLEEATARLANFVETNRYQVFVAREIATNTEVGCLTMHESYALYAGGAFGTIPELYVRPDFRQRGVGKLLLDAARKHGVGCGWTRLEVTTPPLPQFDRALMFYEREGFAISGGRKLRLSL